MSETVTIVVWPWSPDPAAAAMLVGLLDSAPANTSVVALDPEVGFAEAVNAAAQAADDTDLVIVADACELPAGWLEHMRAAAFADDTIAAATTLAAGAGSPLFGGSDNDPVLGPGPAFTGSRDGGDPLNPRIFRLWPHCSYIRRSGLELLGPLEQTLTHPEAVLAEFAARALRRGLLCGLADDVVVRRLPGGLAPCPANEIETVIGAYPWLRAARGEEDALELGPLRRALVRARAGGRSLSATIDARALGPTTAGTQTYIAGLVLALARSGTGSVRAIVRDDAPDSAIEEFGQSGVEIVSESRAAGGLERTDVAHRPQQVFVPEDLALLRKAGERVLVSHLDLIAYRSPAYHSSADDWRRYRRLTRLALGAVDLVIFLSEHAREDAVAEELIEPQWTAVSGAGVDQAEIAAGRRPQLVPEGARLLVMIGADYMHKNRLFALELVDQLRLRHGWSGLLVLAGTHVQHGGSAGAEQSLLDGRPELAARVLDLGPVSEDEKRWLLRNAQALLCPSTYEGFGLTPLEAAAAGIPCVYADTTSLREVVGPLAATIVQWDAAASADACVDLLGDAECRKRHLVTLRAALDRYRWGSIAERTWELYRRAIDSPYRSSVPRAWEELLVREQLIVDLDHRYQDLRERVAFGLALIDRNGLLTPREQRGLMRVASRGWLRRPLLGPIGVLGRVRGDDPPASAP